MRGLARGARPWRGMIRKDFPFSWKFSSK
jgi:hypothetical protein